MCKFTIKQKPSINRKKIYIELLFSCYLEMDGCFIEWQLNPNWIKFGWIEQSLSFLKLQIMDESIKSNSRSVLHSKVHFPFPHSLKYMKTKISAEMQFSSDSIRKWNWRWNSRYFHIEQERVQGKQLFFAFFKLKCTI